MERVEVAAAGLGAGRRDRAAGDLLERPHHRVTEPDLAADPLVLLVGPDAVDVDEHPEAPPVHRLDPRLPRELRERRLREDRHRAARTVDRTRAAALGLEQPDAASEVRGHGLRPRADDEPAAQRPAEEVGLDGAVRLDDALGARPVREAQRESARLGVPLGGDRDEPRVAERPVAAAVLVHEREAAVVVGAGQPQVDLGRAHQAQALHGGDPERRDVAHAASLGSLDLDLADAGAARRRGRTRRSPGPVTCTATL